jgi:hypothetical protein
VLNKIPAVIGFVSDPRHIIEKKVINGQRVMAEDGAQS